MLKITSIVFLGLFMALSVQAAVINVPGDEPTIQAGIDAANEGDTVRVAADTYNLTAPATINGKAITLEGAGGSSATFLDGDDNNTLLVIQNAGSNLVVIDGFTFRNGQATDTFHGGCAVVQNAQAQIVNNRFEDCETDPLDSSNSGGAIKVSNGSFVTIDSNVFLNNRSYSQGGAVHILEATGEVLNNTFNSNTAEGGSVSGGGGLKVTRSDGAAVEVRGNTFEGNQASFTGGALSIFDGDAVIDENTFNNNGNCRFGGALHFETGNVKRALELTENTFDGNYAVDRDDPELTTDGESVSGGAAHINFIGAEDSVATIEFNSFSNNTATDSRCTTGAGSEDCAVGGALEFLRGLDEQQIVRGNLFEGNTADSYAAANFDKVQVVFSGNTVRGNRARFTHPGIGCVASSASTATRCDINANHFINNRFVNSNDATSSLNSAGAINVRRNDADIYNNVFSDNEGYFATVFIHHSGISGKSSNVVHNTFYQNDVISTFYGVLMLRGNGLIQANTFHQGFRGIRIDQFDSGQTDFVRFNNIHDTSNGVARIEGTTYNSVADLNAEPEAEETIGVDSGFVSAGTDFSLDESSGLIDVSDCFGLVSVDIIGTDRPFGSDCDIGAYEYFIDSTVFQDRFEES